MSPMEEQMKAPVVFVDCETTGLSPDVHDPWEIALIEADGKEHIWLLKPMLIKACRINTDNIVVTVQAEEGALRVNRYYERVAKHDDGAWCDPKSAAWEIAVLTSNKMIVGNVPSFDAAFLDRFLRRNGLVPAWHYHLCDVEALAAGYLCAKLNYEAASDEEVQKLLDVTSPPWKSRDLSRAVGVEPPGGADAHTALADARWAKAIYEKVIGR